MLSFLTPVVLIGSLLGIAPPFGNRLAVPAGNSTCCCLPSSESIKIDAETRRKRAALLWEASQSMNESHLFIYCVVRNQRLHLLQDNLKKILPPEGNEPEQISIWLSQKALVLNQQVKVDELWNDLWIGRGHMLRELKQHTLADCENIHQLSCALTFLATDAYIQAMLTHGEDFAEKELSRSVLELRKALSITVAIEARILTLLSQCCKGYWQYLLSKLDKSTLSSIGLNDARNYGYHPVLQPMVERIRKSSLLFVMLTASADVYIEVYSLWVRELSGLEITFAQNWETSLLEL